MDSHTNAHTTQSGSSQIIHSWIASPSIAFNNHINYINYDYNYCYDNYQFAWFHWPCHVISLFIFFFWRHDFDSYTLEHDIMPKLVIMMTKNLFIFSRYGVQRTILFLFVFVRYTLEYCQELLKKTCNNSSRNCIVEKTWGVWLYFHCWHFWKKKKPLQNS